MLSVCCGFIFNRLLSSSKSCLWSRCNFKIPMVSFKVCMKSWCHFHPWHVFLTVCQMVNETKHGCSILVSAVPKPTAAKFSLQDPSEVFPLVYAEMKSYRIWPPSIIPSLLMALAIGCGTNIVPRLFRLWSFCAGLCTGSSGDLKAVMAFRWVSPATRRYHKSFTISVQTLLQMPPVNTTTSYGHNDLEMPPPI